MRKIDSTEKIHSIFHFLSSVLKAPHYCSGVILNSSYGLDLSLNEFGACIFQVAAFYATWQTFVSDRISQVFIGPHESSYLLIKLCWS